VSIQKLLTVKEIHEGPEDLVGLGGDGVALRGLYLAAALDREQQVAELAHAAGDAELEADGEQHGEVVERRVERVLQVVQDVGRVLLQLVAAHRLEHLLQLHAQLLNVVHEDAGDALVLHVVWEVNLDDLGVRHQHFDDRLGEPLHVALPDLRVGTLELGHHVEALRQLREHVHHRVREQRVLAAPLELFRGQEKSHVNVKRGRGTFSGNVLIA
jgi:hypothetical protein